MGRALRSQNKNGTTEKKILLGVRKNDSQKRLVLSDQTNSQSKANSSVNGKNITNRNLRIKDYFSPSPKGSPQVSTKILEAASLVVPKASGSEKEQKRVPIYRKQSMRRTCSKLLPEQKGHLYDFEVDENEPKVGRKKRRRIQKIKLIRPRKKKPPVPVLRMIDLDALDNVINKNNVVTHSTTKMSSFHHVGTDLKPAECSIKVQQENNILSPIKIGHDNVHHDIPILFNNSAISVEEPPSPILNTTRNLYIDKTIETPMQQSYYSSPELPASTPVKQNSFNSPSEYTAHDNATIINSFNTSNCFGFDEPALFEEPLVSPIKPEVTQQILIPVINQEKNTPSSEMPIQNIIKMLRFEDVDPKAEENTKGGSETSNPEEITMRPENFMDLMPTHYKTPHRRSYERPFKPRRHDHSSESESEDERAEENKKMKKKQQKEKRKMMASKKDQKEMEKWIKSFNSQCAEVEQFDLCVE